jgi:hypothetical protein
LFLVSAAAFSQAALVDVLWKLWRKAVSLKDGGCFSLVCTLEELAFQQQKTGAPVARNAVAVEFCTFSTAPTTTAVFDIYIFDIS